MFASVLIQFALRQPLKCGDGSVLPHQFVIYSLIFTVNSVVRWFAWQGSYHPHPVIAQRGLLQGCPASPALLNALMTVWVRFVKRAGTKDFLWLFIWTIAPCGNKVVKVLKWSSTP